LLERLEDRTVPTLITVLGSDLHTARGVPEFVRVAETGAVEGNGTDFTFDAAPGVYHLTDDIGASTYGSFTVASDGTISGTTGALVASGSTIDFDLTKLAAVTVVGTDLNTPQGSAQFWGVGNVFPTFTGADTVYVPAGTFDLTVGSGAPPFYGSFTVSASGPGAFTITATTGAAVATGNTIDFDLTKLAAVTVAGTDLTTPQGSAQFVGVGNVVATFTGDDTVHVPAGTFVLTVGSGAPPFYGSFTVSASGPGAFAVTATTGAAVATTSTRVDIDVCELDRVQITPNPAVRWYLVNVTTALSSASDVVALGDGSYTLGLYDPSGNFSTATFSVSMASGLSATQLPQSSPLVTLALVPCAPVVGPITAPLTPVPVNTAVAASASFTDPDVFETHTAVWNWGDGTTSAGTVTESNGSGSVSGSHPYTVDGVYTVTLTVTDTDGASGQSVFQFVVVYNPGAGFVTGGGWIPSPAGAYAANPSLTGKATFGLNAKYKSGDTVPTGNTEFQFPAGNFNFHATAYDWLVITTNQAQYQGAGTINGAGNIGFLVTVLDNGGTTPDKFRLQIWDKSNNNAVVYDTQPGDPATAAPTTALGGGRIQVHTNAQLVAGGADPTAANVAPLTPTELRPVVQEAIALWAAAGIDPARVSALSQVSRWASPSSPARGWAWPSPAPSGSTRTPPATAGTSPPRPTTAPSPPPRAAPRSARSIC
jgi:hypothetical protein